MKFRIIRKVYRSTKDMHPDNPCKTVDLGFSPTTLEDAKVILPKVMGDKLWINQIVPA